MTSDYYVIFSPGSGIVKPFLKKGFAHTYVIKSDGPNWLKIDPCFEYLKAEILPFLAQDYEEQKADNVPVMAVKSGLKVIKVTIKRPTRTYNISRYFSCVGTVQYILGISLLAFTPFGLYKKLKKMSAKKKRKYNIITINEVNHGTS